MAAFAVELDALGRLNDARDDTAVDCEQIRGDNLVRFLRVPDRWVPGEPRERGEGWEGGARGRRPVPPVRYRTGDPAVDRAVLRRPTSR
ncbi:hypothetical protein ACQEVC_28200 [Plantactinospora sp. CA-294935]|uniref:hypothetical protein n=1 Tax=Plantactinospora sp. CA-294935 TaxID=3240012 RepID=UPI003D8B074A